MWNNSGILYFTFKSGQAESSKRFVNIVPDDGTIETNNEFSIISPEPVLHIVNNWIDAHSLLF